jgi:glycosyltransferase involved in cell wall biosynthesis
MKILFIAFSNSIHVVRWLDYLQDQNWDIHLFPSVDGIAPHSLLKGITVHHTIYAYNRNEPPNANIRERGLRFRSPILRSYRRSFAVLFRLVLQRFYPQYQQAFLKRVIRRLKPDIIHSIEFQHAGYLTLQIKRELSADFPPWIVTNYGSDIYLYSRLAEHHEQIKELLANADYYTCECERDIHLAREMGFEGEVLTVLPNAGGFDMAHLAELRQTGAVSARRTVVLKGYQNWAGRALVGLRAIALCADALKDYRVAIYSATSDVTISAELLTQSTGLQIDIIPTCSHDEMLALFNSARVYIGLSISDAASTSMLEAMAMGTFPIQSCTACVDEWLVDGETGLVVPPEDPEIIAQALRRALSDDALVDNAAERNIKMITDRLDHSVVKPQIVSLYERVATQGKI